MGPVHIDLADLKWSQDLQDELDKVAQLLLAVAVLYILGAGFSGLALLGSAAGLAAYGRHPRATAAANAVLAWLAALTLLVANVATTVGGQKGADEINSRGQDIGLSASAGGKLIAIAWAAFALMVVAAIYWTYEVVAVRRARRRIGGPSHHNKQCDRPSMDESSPRLRNQHHGRR